MKIAVFMGGVSSEREISIKTGRAILASLLRQNYDAYEVVLNKENLISAFIENDYDLAYIALHGEFGEDGRIQSILDILGKKYTGSSVTGSAVSMDKDLTKKIAESVGIRVAKSYSKEDIHNIERYPIVVKPATEGSTVGLYICNDKKELIDAIEKSGNRDLVIEEFIKGEELTAGVIDDEALGVLKITPKAGLYDFKSKYTSGMTNYEYPAKIKEEYYNEAMESSKLIHSSLKLSGVSRSDFILAEDGLYFLEVNSCPGMTETSLIPKLGTLKGYTFDDIVRKIVEKFS